MFWLAMSVAAQAQTFTVIHTFTGGDDGASPLGVVIDRGGNLYGDASAGGARTFYCQQYGCGTIFKLSNRGGGWSLSTLYRFYGNIDGIYPGQLTLAADGTLYGTSQGAAPYVRVYRLRPPSNPCRSVSCEWTFIDLFNFDTTQNGGAAPTLAPLALDGSGNIYGVTSNGGLPDCGMSRNLGCGTVFELSQSGGVWNLDFIHQFDGTDGAEPAEQYTGVILDRFGNVYGTTTYGGPTRNYGTVFQIAHTGSGWTENVVKEFSHDNDDQGRYPRTGLVMDSGGNLYGSTSYGGTGLSGTAFELSYSGQWNFSLMYAFSSQNNGGDSVSPLAIGPDGSLYGTTPFGGQYSMGTLFKLTNSGGGWTYTSIHDFTGGDGGYFPIGAVVFDAQGNIYGVTLGGGSYNLGVAYQITAN